MKNITLGILGGGQLGRMSSIAAAQLGIQVHIFTPEENSPASQVSAKTYVAKYSDEKQLAEFAKGVDFITYEFENIPVQTVQYLKQLKPVYPDYNLLEVAQDRLIEKQFLNDINIETARFRKYETLQSISQCKESWGLNDFILKTTRFGYDGKGQVRYNIEIDKEEKIKQLSGDIIIEEIINFDFEISVIVARNEAGQIEVYGPVLNEHKHHILHKTTSPAPIGSNQFNLARTMATNLANELNLIGVLALELFVTKDGKILANEIAPRPHNSGHWSIEGAKTSQFENHVRAVCGLPLGSAENLYPTEMLNLIGDDAKDTDQYLKQKNACLHLYGKQDIRDGRKMGHVTFIKQD